MKSAPEMELPIVFWLIFLGGCLAPPNVTNDGNNTPKRLANRNGISIVSEKSRLVKYRDLYTHKLNTIGGF